MYKILLVEDDYEIRQIIVQYFKNRDIEVVEAINGYEGIEKMNESFQVVLLDIMMPGIDGYEVCYQIRQKYPCPILFISALSDEDTQLKTFACGGDDYISKPFLPSVLYAKCLSICHRQNSFHKDIKHVGAISIDFLNHQVWVNHEELILTHKEYLLLEYFIKNARQLLSREQILDALWGYDYYGNARAVDTYVKKLRKKLNPYQDYIHTVFKVGYLFKEGDEDVKKN